MRRVLSIHDRRLHSHRTYIGASHRRSCMDGTHHEARREPRFSRGKMHGVMLNPKENETLALHTTLRVGGPARFFFCIQTLSDLEEAVLFAEAKRLPVLVLGGGSNVLFGDSGFSGVVLHMKLPGVEYRKEGLCVYVTAGAGEDWDAFVAETTKRGLWGLENLSAIPGTVGAAPVQNVGAYGVEAKDVIAAVQVFDTRTKTLHIRAPSECAFGYRDSVFKHEAGGHLIVTSVTFCLSETPNPKRGYPDVEKILQGAEGALTPGQIRDVIVGIRSRKLPDVQTFGTAGSFFKNPIIETTAYDALLEKWPELPSFSAGAGKVKIPLAWILDHVLHLNGFREKNVGLWPAQPLVVVHYGGATAEEIDIFADNVAQKIFDATGIRVAREVVTLM